MIELLAESRDMLDLIELFSKFTLAVLGLLGALAAIVAWIRKTREQESIDSIVESTLKGRLSDENHARLKGRLAWNKVTIRALSLILGFVITLNIVIFVYRYLESQPIAIEALEIADAGLINIDSDDWLNDNTLLFDLVHQMVSEFQNKEMPNWAPIQIRTQSFGLSNRKSTISSTWRVRMHNDFNFNSVYVFLQKHGEDEGFIKSIKVSQVEGLNQFTLPETDSNSNVLIIGILNSKTSSVPKSYKDFFKLEKPQ